ncbi:SGNH/GDSL hydrolase family protein [Lactobacillus johnsonii]|uniref:BppU N-terminal domain-containing protein n=1 Tax=Lactobacillus johnsonii TaxID=33959 RepID=A0A9X0SCF7_LACJH|nr:SGNH/GDSL hydrolase family protein [Lactobacillus johnsonii]KXN76870.1 hypothetical protein AYJ53_07330 [Lactobacillus johnsonii]
MDTINLVNNGKPYFFRLDIAKESGQIARFTDWIKTRVSDNGKKVPIQWYDQGTVMNVHGFYPFIEGGVGKWIKDDDTGELVPSTDVVYRTWQGTPADTSDNGIAYYTLEDQFFTKQGEFVGTFGLRDDNGNNLTSVNLVFSILGNDLRLTQAKDYYIKDLENLKRKFENDGNQAVKDFNAKGNDVINKFSNDYNVKTQAAQDALVKATKDLSSYATTVETMDAQIKAKALATKPDLDQAKSDITKIVEDKTANLTNVAKANFNTIASLDQLKKDLATGAEGYWITLDTKHMYIWAGSDWTDLGSAGIGDGTVPGQTIKAESINNAQIGTISASKIFNSFSDISKAEKWGMGGTDLYVAADNAVIQLLSGKGDRGIAFPVEFTGYNWGWKNLYIDFNYYFTKKVDNYVSVYVMRDDNTILLDQELWVGKKMSDYVHVCIPAAFIQNNSLSQKFKVLVACHGEPSTLDVEHFRVSDDSNNSLLPDKFKDLDLLTVKNGFNLAEAQGWQLTQGSDYFYADSTEAVFKTGDASSNKGIVLKAHITPGVTNYIQVQYGIVSAAQYGIAAFLSNGRNLNDGVFAQFGSVETNTGIHTLTYKLTPAEIIRLGINDECTLTIGGNVNALILKSATISTTRNGAGVLEAINNDDTSKKVIYGSSIHLINSANSKSIDGLKLVTPGEKYDQDNGRLDHITLYAKEKGSTSIYIGKLDQNNLLVDYKQYVLNYSAGYNEFDFLSQDIPVNNGDYVFVDCSSLGVYQPDSSHPLANTTRVQDAHHIIQGQYSGNTFYSGNFLAPFEYSVVPATSTQLAKSLNNDITTTSEKIDTIKKQVKQVAILTSPSGKKFRISVDDNGTLSATSTVPSNVQVFGNSLTGYYKTGSPALGATDPNHDWFHYFSEYVKNINPNAVVDRHTVAPWEQNATGRDVQFDQLFKPYLSQDTNLVVLQVGDNVNRDDSHATFKNDVMDLFKRVKEVSPKAKIYFVGIWFCNWPDMIDSVKAACDKYDGTFVNITDLATEENRSRIGEQVTLSDGSTTTISTGGEAIHPGNAGYKKIANRLIDSLDF